MIRRPCIVCGVPTEGSRCERHAHGGRLARPCLRCSKTAEGSDYCTDCLTAIEAERNLSPGRDYGPVFRRNRLTALRRAGHRCEQCTSTVDLEVHHRIAPPRGSHSFRNLIVLCRDCHHQLHNAARRQRTRR